MNYKYDISNHNKATCNKLVCMLRHLACVLQSVLVIVQRDQITLQIVYVKLLCGSWWFMMVHAWLAHLVHYSGAEMACRSIDHILQYGELTLRQDKLEKDLVDSESDQWPNSYITKLGIMSVSRDNSNGGSIVWI